MNLESRWVRQKSDQSKGKLEAEKNDLEMLTEDLIMDNAHKSTLPHVRKNVTIIRRLIIKSENTLYILLVFMCVCVYIYIYIYIYIYMIYVYTRWTINIFP